MGILQIGVLGAGIVGVSTATQLQAEFPTAQVTILADKFNADTTSAGAAGIFRPSTSFCGPTQEITRKWIEDAYDYYNSIQLSEQSARAGVSLISGYIFSSTHHDIVRNHYLEPIVPIYRAATQAELKLCPGDWKYGSFFTTLLTECRKFLPWSLERFTERGGKIEKRIVNNFQELERGFDIIVNCTGLQAKYLCSDNKMVPIRGQVIKVQAPWIKTFFYADYDTYIIPTSEGVTLGGCRHYESYDDSIWPQDSSAIKERCYRLVPNLKPAHVIKEWAGLRPHRSEVRVEPQILRSGLNTLKIVHNYGHGGYGVTSAPGTAKYAVKLVREIHSASKL